MASDAQTARPPSAANFNSRRLRELSSRLTSIDRANRSLRMLRQSDARNFDLTRLDELADGRALKALTACISEKAFELVSEKDRARSDELAETLAQAERAHAPSARNARVTDAQTETASGSQLYHRFKRRVARTPFETIERNLTSLVRTITGIEAETGAHDLYVGFPWLCGCCGDPDNTYIQAPLMLWPVRLLVSRSPRLSWRIEPLAGEEPFFNETLRLGLGQFHSALLPEDFLDEAAKFALETDDPAAIAAWLVERFKVLGLNAVADGAPPVAFREYKAADVPSTPPGQFSIVPMTVLGHFPQSNTSLTADYEEMGGEATQGKALPRMVEELLGAQVSAQDREADSNSEAHISGGAAALTTDNIREGDTCFVIPTDASQEEVLLAARKHPALVVHGPPGTGKSQVIVNLISDALWRGERVLLCCQKRAALDVVYARLKENGLGDNVAVVHDPGSDRKEVYQHIAAAIDTSRVRENKQQALAAEADRLAAAIDRTTAYFKDAATALHKLRRCGLTAHQLYARDVAHAQVQALPAGALDKAAPVAAALDANELGVLAARVASLQKLAAQVGGKDHPWAGRTSFAKLGLEDERKAREALQRFALTCEGLGKAQAAAAAMQGATGSTCFAQRGALALLAGADSQGSERVRALADKLLSGAVTQSDAERLADGLATPAKRIAQFGARPAANEEGDVGAIAASLEIFSERRGKFLKFLDGEFRRAKATALDWLRARGHSDDVATVAAQVRALRCQQAWADWDKLANTSPLGAVAVLVNTPSDVSGFLGDLRAAASLAKDLQAALAGLGPLSAAFAVANTCTTLTIPGNALKSLGDAYAACKAACDGLAPWLRAEVRERVLAAADADAKRGNGLAAKLIDGLRDFPQLVEYDEARTALGANERALLDVLAGADVATAVQRAIVRCWIEEAERESPVLAHVSRDDFARLRTEFATLLKERRAVNQQLLALRLHERGAKRRFEAGREVDGRHSPEKAWNALEYEVSKQRRLWPMRKLVREMAWPLNEVMPCWLASPEAVSTIFPKQAGLFDLVIFDEASQCAVEHGLPALYRAKRSVIVGDEQQLQPSDFFRSVAGGADPANETTSDDDADDAGEPADERAMEAPSILTLARAHFPTQMLTWHYRSKFEELIGFSNYGFYQGRLKTFPPFVQAGFAPIEFKRVKGTWSDRRNPDEASAVLDTLAALLKSEDGKGRSAGIITFNITQQTELLDQIDRRRAEDPEFDALMLAATGAAEGAAKGREEPFFVKNIENVQGDERDVILFSVGYGPDEAGRVRANFGALNRSSGENRLNVAVTRARERVIVVSSVDPEQLEVSGASNRGPRLLRQYLEYARAITARNDAARVAVLRDINPSLDVAGSAAVQFDSDFEELVFNALQAKGLAMRTQVGVSGYRIDLAVVDPNDPMRYLLGIECDGATYHSARSVRERDAYRQQFLERRGWRIHRIWSRNWWRDPERETAKVLELVAGLPRAS